MSEDSGWRDYRLLVLEMLERHEAAISDMKQSRYEDRERFKEDLLEHCKEMKAEILRDLKPSPAVQAAKITGTWQFWATIVSSVTAIIIAFIALLNP